MLSQFIIFLYEQSGVVSAVSNIAPWTLPFSGYNIQLNNTTAVSYK